MAYTKFRITEFGQRTTAKVNGFIAVLNAWYNSTDALSIHKNNPDHYAEPFDFIKYEYTDDTLISNQAIITVNAPPNPALIPESADDEVNAIIDTEYSLIISMPINSAVDRIKIVDFDNSVGTLSFEGNNIFPGFVMLGYDFDSLVFKTKKGTGEPYQEISYKVGNADGYNPTIYGLKYNIIGLAKIEQVIQEAVTEDGIVRLSSDCLISNGRVNGIAKVTVNVNLSAAAWPIDTENFFNLSYNADDLENNVNFTTDIFVDLDNEGLENLVSELNINTTDLPVTGTITLTLVDINGDTGLVDTGNDTITINVSL